jgi:hypothetical protein
VSRFPALRLPVLVAKERCDFLQQVQAQVYPLNMLVSRSADRSVDAKKEFVGDFKNGESCV